MKKMFRAACSFLMALAMCFSMLQISAFATSEMPYASENNGITTFHNLDQLKDNESVTHEFLDRNGNPASISIKRIPATARSSASWLVSVDSVFVDAEYYVDVTNNKIVNARDWAIYTLGCDYSDVELQYTSSYARLSFKTTIAGVYNGTCWLQATIRGTNNEVDVTHFV